MNINTEILPSSSDTNCVWHEANIVLSKPCILNKAMNDNSQQLSSDEFVNELLQNVCKDYSIGKNPIWRVCILRKNLECVPSPS